MHVQLEWESSNFTGASVPLIESLKSKAHLVTDARKWKNLTHLQSILLFKDSRAEVSSEERKQLHPREINYYGRFIANNPGVVSRRQQRHFAGSDLVFSPVLHAISDTSGYMILQVARLAAFGIYQWFYARRPFPARLEGGTPKSDST